MHSTHGAKVMDKPIGSLIIDDMGPTLIVTERGHELYADSPVNAELFKMGGLSPKYEAEWLAAHQPRG